MTGTTTTTTAGSRSVRAPRGTQISCEGRRQEAALRMLVNGLEPDVAEKADEGTIRDQWGKAGRSGTGRDRSVTAQRL